MPSIVDMDQLSDQVVFINMDIRCWTGRKHLQPEDLGLDRTQLPPEKLVALGSKWVIDPTELQVFTRKRAAVRRECLAVGTRFLGGYGVPESQAQALLDRIAVIEEAFNADRDRFLAKFDRIVEAWITANPAWEQLIRDTGVTRTFVAERLSFAVQALKIVSPTTVTHPGLAKAANGLADNLFEEVSQLARETLEKSYLGKASVTRRALRPLVAIQQKLEGLAFLDRRVRPIAQSIQRTLAALPRQGAIQDRDLQALIGLLSILEDSQRLKAHGEDVLEQQADSDSALDFEMSADLSLSLPTLEDEATESEPESTALQSAPDEDHESTGAECATAEQSFAKDEDTLDLPTAEAGVSTPLPDAEMPLAIVDAKQSNWFF